METIVAHDIVSHNSSLCFTGDTMITLFDGTFEQIEKNYTRCKN